MKKMKKKTMVEASIIILLLAILILFGYRVVITSLEVPGRLSSVSIAATNLNYAGCEIKKVQKIEYNEMKYGYMDGMLLAQMDVLDTRYDDERMEEIRAVNNLTAMSKMTANRVAYEKAKAKQEEEIEKAFEAKKLADAAKEAKIQQIMAERKRQEDIENNRVPIQIDPGSATDTGSGDTQSKGGQKGEPVFATTHGESLGKYVITAYCTCKICCGVYSGGNRTASGTVPTTNRTLAVDTNVIPFGTRLVINGQVYVAEDRGGAIKGKRIDMFFYTHKEALQWGRRTMEVFLAE
ncbi:MAG: 3D domain-containing protein [Eubacteriales bacterium]|nr:3D domain-containing protein [Eubacteriales bacterium]